MSLTDIMSNAGLTFYPLVAFALCFAAFIAIVVREIARSRGEVEHASKLPLAADDPTIASAGQIATRRPEEK